MWRYVVRRLLTSVLVFFGITVLIFVLVRQVPGDPVRLSVNPIDLNEGGQAYIEAQRARLGLDEPIAMQYVYWLRGVAHGELGYSFSSGEPVTSLLTGRLAPTVQLMGTALVVALVVGMVLGVFGALRRNRWPDYAGTVVSLGAVSVPSFFLSLVAIYVFAMRLGWLPSAGIESPGGGTAGDRLAHLVMPATILGLSVAGPLVRYVRGSVLDQLGREHLRAATARGASQARVLVRHALRNALVPLITVLAIQIPLMAAGSVVVEQVFAWPGMGQLAVSSIGRQDYPVIVGFTLVVAALMLLSNLAADLLYGVADPRVRLR